MNGIERLHLPFACLGEGTVSRVIVTQAINSGTLQADGWMLEEENPYNPIGPSDYVDGNQPDCYWLGDPHASRSIRCAKSGYDVLDVRYLSDPSNTLHPGEKQVPWFRVDATASEGRELRIAPALRASQTLILDVLTGARLGEHDLAMVDLPSDEWILAGAAARCLWLLEQRAPGKEAGMYRERRQEAVKLFSRLSQRYQGAISRRVMLDEPY
jgi:hypothetical protein